MTQLISSTDNFASILNVPYHVLGSLSALPSAGTPAQPPALPLKTASLPSIRPLLGPTDSSASSTEPTPPTTGQQLPPPRSEPHRLPSFSALASDSSSSYRYPHPSSSSSYPSSSGSSSHYQPNYHPPRPHSSNNHHLYPPSFSGHPSPQPTQYEPELSGRRSPLPGRNGWPESPASTPYHPSHQRVPSLSFSSDRAGSGSWAADEGEYPSRRTRTSSGDQSAGASKSQAAFVVKLYQ